MEQKYETTVLADTVSENETEEVEEPQTQEIVTDIPQEDNSGEADEEVLAEEPAEETVAEDKSEEETVADSEVSEIIQVTVVGGDGSGTVARKLAEAGLVEDAQAYDKFLCSNGYDKRICTGTHSIPVGASDEEIAKIITSRP